MENTLTKTSNLDKNLHNQIQDTCYSKVNSKQEIAEKFINFL